VRFAKSLGGTFKVFVIVGCYQFLDKRLMKSFVAYDTQCGNDAHVDADDNGDDKEWIVARPTVYSVMKDRRPREL
jgi:hypothetical protein